jgi:hypothetical protein
MIKLLEEKIIKLFLTFNKTHKKVQLEMIHPQRLTRILWQHLQIETIDSQE